MGFLRKWWKRLMKSKTLKWATAQAAAVAGGVASGQVNKEQAIAAGTAILGQIIIRAYTKGSLADKD